MQAFMPTHQQRNLRILVKVSPPYQKLKFIILMTHEKLSM